jgi:hypothetical protein
MFRNKDIILIKDEDGRIFDLIGEVVGHNHITDEVAYRIIANDYKGLTIYTAKAKYCTLLERNGIKQNLNDNK